MKAGANGFISKQNHLADLAHTIKAVFSGYDYFPLRLHMAHAQAPTESDAERLRTLSQRECEVLRYLAEGNEIIIIAARMGISNKTVSTCKTRQMKNKAEKSARFSAFYSPEYSLLMHQPLLPFARILPVTDK